MERSVVTCVPALAGAAWAAGAKNPKAVVAARAAPVARAVRECLFKLIPPDRCPFMSEL